MAVLGIAQGTALLLVRQRQQGHNYCNLSQLLLPLGVGSENICTVQLCEVLLLKVVVRTRILLQLLIILNQQS